MGVLVNMTTVDSGLLLRWTSVADHADGGNSLSLCRLQGEKMTLLARARGGFLPGQWYRLSVASSLEGVRVSIDGRERLFAPGITPWRGGVGLYAEGDGGVFNDVTAYGRTLKTDLITEHRLARFNERFQEDKKGMGEWALVQGDWQPFPKVAAYQLHRLPFYGDHWLTLPVKVSGTGAGALKMILDCNGQDLQSGVRAVIMYSADGSTLTCTFFRGEKALATKTLPALAAGDEYTFRFFRAGGSLGLELDGAPMLAIADSVPAAGHLTAYSLSGVFSQSGDALALGHNVLDYSFADAPVDWLAAGTWMPTNRWACSSHWSFLGGWSRGDAVLWHKERFSGAQFFEAFMATKMEYPRERQVYWHSERERDFAITICGDGHDPRSGYAGIFGDDQCFATAEKRTVLLRNGVEVGSAPFLASSVEYGHTAWFHLELRKNGATVEFWVGGQLAVRYTDPLSARWRCARGVDHRQRHRRSAHAHQLCQYAGAAERHAGSAWMIPGTPPGRMWDARCAWLSRTLARPADIR